MMEKVPIGSAMHLTPARQMAICGGGQAALDEARAPFLELAALRAEVAGLRKNSERYCWLKIMKVGRNPDFAGYWILWNTPPLCGETIDAAIDAAMERAAVPAVG